MLGSILLTVGLFIVSSLEEDNKYQLNGIENSVSDQNTVSSILGENAKAYPTYTDIPNTEFSCKGRLNWGYYADVEAECQVFHVCEAERSKISFLCPIGSIFNQRHLVCDWWYNFDCSDAIILSTFPLGYDNHPSALAEGYQPGLDLNLASSGGNSDNESDAANRTQRQKDTN